MRVITSVKFLLISLVILSLLAVGCSSPTATTNAPLFNQSTIPTTTNPPNTTVPGPTIPVPITINPIPTTTTPIPTTTIPVTTTSGYAISVATKAGIGNYLVDSRGMALYYTTSDRPNFSNLPDETLTNWPVFYTAGITVGPTLNAADFGTFTRDQGTKQTTYKGYPLYYSRLDRLAGDTLGHRQGGTWFLVVP